MFRGTVTYKKGGVLEFSNPEGSFISLFDVENLPILLGAFRQDHVEVRGEVLPEDPLRFVIDGVRFGDFDLDIPYVQAVARYLKMDFTPKIEVVFGGNSERHIEEN